MNISQVLTEADAEEYGKRYFIDTHKVINRAIKYVISSSATPPLGIMKFQFKSITQVASKRYFTWVVKTLLEDPLFPEDAHTPFTRFVQTVLLDDIMQYLLLDFAVLDLATSKYSCEDVLREALKNSEKYCVIKSILKHSLTAANGKYYVDFFVMIIKKYRGKSFLEKIIEEVFEENKNLQGTNFSIFGYNIPCSLPWALTSISNYVNDKGRPLVIKSIKACMKNPENNSTFDFFMKVINMPDVCYFDNKRLCASYWLLKANNYLKPIHFKMVLAMLASNHVPIEVKANFAKGIAANHGPSYDKKKMCAYFDCEEIKTAISTEEICNYLIDINQNWLTEFEIRKKYPINRFLTEDMFRKKWKIPEKYVALLMDMEDNSLLLKIIKAGVISFDEYWKKANEYMWFKMISALKFYPDYNKTKEDHIADYVEEISINPNFNIITVFANIFGASIIDPNSTHVRYDTTEYLRSNLITKEKVDRVAELINIPNSYIYINMFSHMYTIFSEYFEIGAYIYGEVDMNGCIVEKNIESLLGNLDYYLHRIKNINRQYKNGNTLLHYITKCHYFTKPKSVIKNLELVLDRDDIDFNITNDVGTAFELFIDTIIQWKHINYQDLADITIKFANKMKPIRNRLFFPNLLSKNPDPELIKFLLDIGLVRPEDCESDPTFLHRLIQNPEPNPNLVKLLVDKKIGDPNHCDDYGNTPLLILTSEIDISYYGDILNDLRLLLLPVTDVHKVNKNGRSVITIIKDKNIFCKFSKEYYQQVSTFF